MISQLLNPKDHVLEIATGTSIIALELAHRIKCIEAIDFSPDMLLSHLMWLTGFRAYHKWTFES